MARKQLGPTPSNSTDTLIKSYLDGRITNATGKTLTVNNSLVLAGTDATTMTFPSASGTVVTMAAAQALTNKDLSGSGMTWPTNLAAFNGKTAPTGTVVGTSDAQTLTNKTESGVVITGYAETVQALGTLGSTKILPSIASGTMLWGTLTSATACTVTMPTAAAGLSFLLALRQPASGTATSATFTGVKWPSTGAPTITPTVGNADLFSFLCYDGTNWYGSYVQGYIY